MVVLPSLYEGFGLPAAEAMACETPVVATAVGALPEIPGRWPAPFSNCKPTPKKDEKWASEEGNGLRNSSRGKRLPKEL